ncbi:hypothetical protein LF599_06695 [Pseudodesulfovibrio thermohalotolerans]|uniref:hypothetical protein n=1 Tax=Pseudodesulfovibrio thermohalotolerans TaxID=2880651 RepID=UPI00244324F7|nr:hypothetical protein [Pseudodesulfovibrio thermohalotolerans]WFS63844.1 hypothetical protein LF599_06695 [Pseudodesulfovibrio thermohalotolerans]
MILGPLMGAFPSFLKRVSNERKRETDNGGDIISAAQIVVIRYAVWSELYEFFGDLREKKANHNMTSPARMFANMQLTGGLFADIYKSSVS